MRERSIDVIWFGPGVPRWTLGEVFATQGDPASVRDAVDACLSTTSAELVLFWDGALGAPDPRRVVEASRRAGDAWHAGLRLGTGGAPGVVDFVQPCWMLNRDPDADVEATSWRVSLRACLVRTAVLRALGGPRAEFSSLEAAALELGHRYVNRGVRVRQVPWLVGTNAVTEPVRLAFEDELRFARFRYGRFWSRWALGRAIASGYVSPARALAAARAVFAAPASADPEPFPHALPPALESDRDARVTVLIPTLERQEYLRRVLEQLREQTIPPAEILVIDQTPAERRDVGLAADFADLPLRVFTLDAAGQCSSRNLGLREARGDYVLFLDDDDEIEPDLIATHLRNMRLADDEVSCGIAHEVGAGPTPEHFSFARASDVFPTNNTLVRRSTLVRSGLFDLAYERGQRADRDLGMRVYLSGAMMMLNPAAAVLHHHAPRGGLREHKARVVTYAGSRSSVTVRHLPTATEIYLARRYFTPRQVRESLWLRVFGTFSARGGRVTRLLKAAHGALSLPSTLNAVRENYASASRLLGAFPQIDELAPAENAAVAVHRGGSRGV